MSENRSFWQLNISDEFSAAHALRHYEGKCENIHGHNFSVELCIQGQELDKNTGLILDFKVLKTILKEVIAGLDHSLLNDLPPFRLYNPSSENISRYIYKEIQARLERCEGFSERTIKLVSVKLSEKEGQSATYFSL